jgi:dipeptidyl aminopeptidase/acylaminoacyl peptidase
MYAVAAALGLVVVVAAVRALPAAKRAVSNAMPRGSAPAAPATLAGALLYTVRDGDRSTIHRVAPGTAPRGAVPAAGVQGAALAAPDGSALLYLQADCQSCAALYILRDVRSGQTRILGSAPLRPLYNELRPDASFSSDGRFVAFAEAGADAPTPHIFIFDRQSGERHALAPYDPTPEDSPVWAPDGRSLVFLSGGPQTVVTLVNVETGEPRPLNDQLDHASELAWSPDGRYLSLLRGGQLWLIEAESGHGFALPAPGVVRAVGGWAPGSGELIAVIETSGASDSTATPEGSAPAAVAAIPISGGAPRILAHGPVLGAPRWSADGRWIAWAQGSDNGWTLRMTPADGGEPRTLGSGAGQITLDGWR